MPNVGVRAASLAVESRKRLSPGILIVEVRIRRKAITAYGQDTRDRGRQALIPSFDDGMVNMAEPIRLMAESFI